MTDSCKKSLPSRRDTLRSALALLAAPAAGCGGGGSDAASHPLADSAVPLAFETQGDPARPMLLLVHGGTANRRAWDLVVPLLRDSYFMVAVDMRGHGESPVPTTGYSALQLSADLSRLLDARGWRGVTVVGHSIGGMAALFLAAHRPDRVSRLVLLDTPVTPNTIPAIVDPVTGLNAFIQNAAKLPFAADDPFVVNAWNKYPVSLPPAFLATLIAGTAALPKVTWQQLIGEVARADITALLPRVAQPTLVVWGAMDGLLEVAPPAPQVPQYQQLLKGLPNATLFPIIAAAGHNPNYESPAVLAQAIRSFAR